MHWYPLIGSAPMQARSKLRMHSGLSLYLFIYVNNSCMFLAQKLLLMHVMFGTRSACVVVVMGAHNHKDAHEEG